MKKTLLSILLIGSVSLSAQTGTSKITVHADQGKNVINKEIYGQFAEHLGSWIP